MNTKTRKGPSQVITSSRIRLFWLTVFKGYAVVTTKSIPLRHGLGGIVYARKWVLRIANADSSAKDNQ